jgi:carboxypeptidase C (cathepsin A)
VDGKRHAFDTQIGSTDDLRYAMALNPHMKVFLTHGYYDLVTPYFASNRICNLLKLDPELRKNLFLRHFEGGHMFYSWESTRFEFRDAMRDFYEIAVG